MAWNLKFGKEEHPRFLTVPRAEALLARYRGRSIPSPTYATVEDYCDSVDHIPELTGLGGDLKDVQRPWTFKALLGLLTPKSTVVEIGAGRPTVAQALVDCGHKAIAVDPYEGAGNGPTEYEEYRKQFPAVEIRKAFFDESLDLPPVDAIYSISTLEHIPDLAPVFRAIRRFLKPGGLSLHCIDIVTDGYNNEFHHAHARAALAFHGAGAAAWDPLLAQARADVETYWLGPSGHQLWRGAVPYRDFPFRKVLSLQVHARASDLLLPNL